MRSIRRRVERLERRHRRVVPVLILDDDLSPGERQAAMEEHRCAYSAAPSAPVVVLTPEEARL